MNIIFFPLFVAIEAILYDLVISQTLNMSDFRGYFDFEYWL